MANILFYDRLAHAIAATGTRVCIGIDPHSHSLPDFMAQTLIDAGAYDFLLRFSMAFIEAGSGKAPAVKFQSAFFEAFGAAGFQALKDSIAEAKRAGFLTILDAKRGDISSTMAAYGKMAFDYMEADCLTVTPYMGFDVVTPLQPWLQMGKGIFVVWLSSNSDGRYLQDLKVVSSAGAESTLAMQLLTHFEERFAAQHLEKSLGLVLGVTRLDSIEESDLVRVGEHALLMPGLGAQGGEVNETFKALLSHAPAALVPISRGLSGLGGKGEMLASVVDWHNYIDFIEKNLVKARADLPFDHN